ncbi:Ribonuclease R winged-helix domain containing protein [Mycobacteriaceae bacterium]|jgi:Fe2+ or Zn2+ uptake regulation protein
MVNTTGLTGVQEEMLAVLLAAAEPITATELRARLNAARPVALVTEQVYRRLVALERRGLIQRAGPIAAGARNHRWQPTGPARHRGVAR